VESNLRLLDQSRPLERIVKDFKLLDGQVSIHFYYDAFDPDAGGREACHLRSVLPERGSVEEER